VALTTANLPAHTHSLALNASSGGGTQASPSGGVPAVESTGTSQNYSTNTPDVTMSSQNVGATGSGTAVSVIQPVLALNFIIATIGTFPSRS
jgi:microcystin-dependent protein